ncbi:MAG: imelysin family protein [Myxococcota bacterium]
MNPRSLFLCLVLALVLGCSGSSEPAFDQSALVDSLGTVVIIPTYEAFADEADALAIEAEAFCADPTVSALESLQAQWRSARVRWKQNDVIAFGPYREQPWRLGPRIDFFPVREDTIAENLAVDEPFTLERVSALGTASRGLATMEFLIFDTDGVDAALSRLQGEDGAQACDYAVALAQDLSVNAEAMVTAWSEDGDNYLGSLLDSGEPGTQFDSVRAVTNEIVNRMLFVADDIRVKKLGAPLGVETGGEPRPDEVESRYSDHSLADILANLDGLENLYQGEFEGTSGISVREWVETRNRRVAGEVLDEIENTRSAVLAIPEPLRLSVETDPALVETAIDAAFELRNAIGIDMVNALGSTVNFNDTDGD